MMKKKLKFYKFESNSSDISINLEKSILENLENKFNIKEDIYNKENVEKEKIKINCQVNEPEKVCFSIDIRLNDDISLLKQNIFKKLSENNQVYKTINPNSFCLMKNYNFIKENGTINDCGISDEDNIYIIMKDIMKKIINNENKIE